MKILALDTSTSRVTVALIDNEILVREVVGGDLVGSQFHGELLAGLIKDCLQSVRPDAIAVGCGPGPYTGLRVGIATAEVLAAAWEIPICGIPTLQALAHGHIRRGGNAGFAVLDVKRKEIAVQEFDGTAHLVGEPQLVHIDNFAAYESKNLVGPAFVTQTLIKPKVGDASSVDAVDIALIAARYFAQGTVQSAQPLYLRAPDAANPKPSKSVL